MTKHQYPECKTVDVREDWFGISLPDPYAWLRDRKDPEVLDFVARENAYTDGFFRDFPVDAKIAALKAAQLPKLPSSLSRFRDGYIGTISREGNYQIRYLNSQLEPVGEFSVPQVLADRIVLSAAPCPVCERYMALMTQKPGAARPTLCVLDTETETLILDADMVFSFEWSEANGCLYYSSSETDPVRQTSHSVFLCLDPQTAQTAKVYEDDSMAIFGQVYASGDGATVMAMVCEDYAHARWIALDAVNGESSPLTEKVVEWEYIDTLNGEHYFISLSDAAHGRVIAVRNTGEVRVALPEMQDVILESGFRAGDSLYLIGHRDVSACLISLNTLTEYPLPSPFAALTYAGEAENHAALLRYESFVDAPQIVRFDGTVWETVRSVAQTAHPDVVTEQHFAVSADGTRVPYYLVRRRDARPDGNNPVLAYAYGGYNVSMPPWYTETVTGTVIPDWVEKGGIYLHINNRGGNEYGPAWHVDGMGMNKRHCYEDFISAVESVIADGWTRKGKVGITGCSNGGLLMSALVTMRPDLWGCVIDSVPHTDMIHFAEDDRGPMYITEYGNPRESREMFEYLLSYSPYHNVKAVEYPPTYIQTGELDNNVPPYHGKKLAARMQAMNTGNAPVLLRVLAEGSHDRGKGEAYWRTIAEMQLFLEHYLKDTDAC